MKTNKCVFTRAACFVLALGSAAMVHAESNFVAATTGALSATARLDFNVTIPRLLYLRVGTGSSFSSNTSVDLLDFTVPAASVGNGTPVVGTGGDLAGGAVTVRVLGNGGNITLKATTTGALTTGPGGATLAWTQIGVTSAAHPSPTAGFTNTGVSHPGFDDAAGTVLTASNGLIRQEGKWTYSYLNQNLVASGTYGGAGVNNGRVTYTATMP